MRNLSASIRERLLVLAKREGVPFQRTLTLYKQEGLLHRIVTTDYGGSVVLKGGLLFFQLQGMVARPTKDIDLLGFEEDRKQVLLRDVLEAAATVQIEDGLTFDRSSIAAAPIAGQTENGGVRGHIVGCIGSARTRLQIDMGFGDVVTGGPVLRPYRTLLDNRSFSIKTYSTESMAAEKTEAIVSLGIVNSRYKDLFDLFGLLVDAGASESDIVEAAANRFLERIGADGPELAMLSNELRPRLVRIYSIARSRIMEEKRSRLCVSYWTQSDCPKVLNGAWRPGTYPQRTSLRFPGSR